MGITYLILVVSVLYKPVNITSQGVSEEQEAVERHFKLSRGKRDSIKLNSNTYLERYNQDKIAELKSLEQDKEDVMVAMVMGENYNIIHNKTKETTGEKEIDTLKMTRDINVEKDSGDKKEETQKIEEEQQIEKEQLEKENEQLEKEKERLEKENEEKLKAAERQKREEQAREKEEAKKKEEAAKKKEEQAVSEKVASEQVSNNSSSSVVQSIKNGARNYSGHVDKNYISKPLKVTGKDRDILERLVMGEAGGEGFEGAVLVSQTIRDTMIYKGYNSVESVRKALKYSGSLKRAPNDDVLRAVEYVFDQGGMGVQHKLIYFYAPKMVSSSFHESQKFIVQYGGHKFFSSWD